jgi:hypothetical protein
LPGRRRALRFGVYAVLAAVAAFVLFLGYTAYQAHRQLRVAQATVGLLRAELVRTDIPSTSIDSRVDEVRRSAGRARTLTDGPAWRLPASLPWAGRPFATVRGIAAAADDLAQDVLPRIAAARATGLTDELKRPGGLDLTPLVSAHGPVTQARASGDRILANVNALPTTGIEQVDGARADLTAQLEELTSQLHTADQALGLVPPMLGSQTPRRYIVAFQNNSEARGAGGLPGVFAILRADRGRLSFEHYGVSGDFSGIQVSLSGLGEGFARHYQGAAPDRFFGNTTVSPHFPDAGELLMRFWEAKSGQRLDGAIATDPSALSLLLAVTGPTRLADGTTISASNVVSLTERDAYQRFTDPVIRKQYLVVVAKAIAGDVLANGPAKPVEMAGALGTAVDQRRLLVYSRRPEEQKVLGTLPVGGALSDTDGLFSGVVINNAGGNKLDYYLERDLAYEAGPCRPGAPRKATVTLRLTNRAPKGGLTDYVAGRADLPKNTVPAGTNRLLVGYYATKGAGFESATLDGKPVLLAVDSERGRPVFTSVLEISPGQSRTLVLQIEEPAAARGPVTTLVQPLVRPQQTHVTAPACATEPR